eukprot:5087169-Amphidinium_carterae.1
MARDCGKGGFRAAEHAHIYIYQVKPELKFVCSREIWVLAKVGVTNGFHAARCALVSWPSRLRSRRTLTCKHSLTAGLVNFQVSVPNGDVATLLKVKAAAPLELNEWFSCLAMSKHAVVENLVTDLGT